MGALIRTVIFTKECEEHNDNLAGREEFDGPLDVLMFAISSRPEEFPVIDPVSNVRIAKTDHVVGTAGHILPRLRAYFQIQPNEEVLMFAIHVDPWEFDSEFF